MKRTATIIALISMFIGISPGVYAASYYSDPVGGSMGNDGSLGSPWGSLEAIFTAGKTFVAGDEIFLMNGAHGQSYISGTHSGYVTIRPFPGHTPRIAAVDLVTGSYWAFDGLVFTSDGTGGTFTKNYMLSARSATTYLKVENCIFYSAESSAAWSKADWYANAKNAVNIRGDQTIFNNNLIRNTYFALEFSGDYVEAKNNVIDNFGADGLRALGSYALYEGNLIRDAYVEDYAVNHDDAIQLFPLLDGAFDPDGVFYDVTFRNNTIYNFADPITQAMIDDDLISYNMQSLIVTDGHIENSVVENNLIVSDHYHGITLSGAINCRIQNNTVLKSPVSINPTANVLPWISLVESKRGIQPANSVIRNNISSKFTPWTHSGGSNILVENNLEPATNQYVNIFSDHTGFNFNLQSNSVAVDAGVNTDLTATDLADNPRLVGDYVDFGAYEFQLPTPYELWIAGYPGVGTATNMTDNPDNDSLNNLYEWGLGGNPNDGDDIGHVPTLGMVERLGATWLEYTYARRSDADALGLVYYAEQCTNLVDGVWTNANYDFQSGDADSLAPGFGTVTNWVDTTVEDAQFLRLIIEANPL